MVAVCHPIATGIHEVQGLGGISVKAIFSVLFFVIPSAYAIDTPLFDEPLKPLQITISANFGLLNTPNQSGTELGIPGSDGRMIDPKYFLTRGKITYPDGAGGVVTQEVNVQPRGVTRRKLCDYKPLEIEFDKKMKTGLFANIRKSLDIVTHCSEYKMAVMMMEYFLYRTKNVFSAPSLHVRLAEITYVDTSGKYPTITRPSYFRESKKDAVERFGMNVMELTEAEEKVPLTAEERKAVDFAYPFGDYLVEKYGMRFRVLKKFDAQKGTVGAALLEDFFSSAFGNVLVPNPDAQPGLSVNVFACEYSQNKRVQFVDYDYDNAYLDVSWSFQGAFENYLATVGMKLSDYKSRTTTAQRRADLALTIGVISKMVAAYDKSDFSTELNARSTALYNTAAHLKVMNDTIVRLKQAIKTPEQAFSFLF